MPSVSLVNVCPALNTQLVLGATLPTLNDSWDWLNLHPTLPPPHPTTCPVTLGEGDAVAQNNTKQEEARYRGDRGALELTVSPHLQVDLEDSVKVLLLHVEQEVVLRDACCVHAHRRRLEVLGL